MKYRIIQTIALVFLYQLSMAQGGSWATKSALTISNTLIGQRFAPVGFSINGKGYYGTGSQSVSSSTRYKDFWSYDPTTDRWTQIADLEGAERSSAYGFAIGTSGYVGGGMTILGPVDDFFQYNSVTNLWNGSTDLPNYSGYTGRVGAFATTIEGEINKAYVGGGGNTEFLNGGSAAYYNDFWEFTFPSTWRKLKNMPKINKDAAMLGKQITITINSVTSPGIQLYVFCGDENGISYTDKIWRFQAKAFSSDLGNWQSISAVYPGGYTLRPASFKLDDNNYYIGSGIKSNLNGAAASTTIAGDCYRFSPDAETFCQVANLPNVRLAPAGFTIKNNKGNKGYFVGGISDNLYTSSATNSVFEFSPLAITTTAVSAVTNCAKLRLDMANDCSYSGDITADLVTVSGTTVGVKFASVGIAPAGASSITLTFTGAVFPGLYRVRLNGAGASNVSSPSVFVVTVTNSLPLPAATISLSGTTLCLGNTLVAKTALLPNIIYNWSVSGVAALTVANQNSATITGTGAGVYTITMQRVSSICGIIDATTTSGTAGIIPNTPTITGPNALCLNQSGTFTGVGSGSILTGWYGFSILGTGTLSQFAFNRTRLTSNVANVVMITSQFNSTCKSAVSAPFLVTIGGSLPPPASISISGTICSGRNTPISVIPFTPAYNYQWSVSSGIALVNSNLNLATITGTSNQGFRI